MKIIRVDQESEVLEWNSLVSSLPEGTIYQTTYWGEYICKEGSKPVFLIAQDDFGKISGSLLAYETGILGRLRRLGKFGNCLYKIINKRKLSITWSYGPLIYDKDKFDEILVGFLNEIERIAKSRGILFLKDITYPVHGDDIYTKRAQKIFSDRGFKSVERATIFLDLAKAEDILWRGLKNSARKAIKKSSNIGFEIRLLERDQLQEYYNLLCESRKRVGIELPPVYPNEAMWEGVGGEAGFLKIFSLMMNGELIGAIGVMAFNGIIFETGPTQSNKSFNTKIYVNDILKWEVIKWGSKNNNRLYDLCGITVKVGDKKTQKQKQFKEKWGGQIVRYQSYSKILFWGD